LTRISKPPQERKKEILDTALQLFMKKGYVNTSVGDIVEKLGVAQGLFYYYFKSKEEVYRAALEQLTDEFTVRLVSIVQGDLPLAEKIELFLKSMDDIIVEADHALMDKVHLAEHVDMDNKLALHVAQSLIEPVTYMLEEMNEKGITKIVGTEATATFLIFGIFGLVHGNPEHEHSKSFFTKEELARMVSGVLGITPEQLMLI
jgi:AcrR family transcriptional regulator